MSDETFTGYLILADKFYAGKNPNADEWTESFNVKGFVRLQGALDWIADTAKEHHQEIEDGGWSVTLTATQQERRDYGLLETVYSIDQVEIDK